MDRFDLFLKVFGPEDTGIKGKIRIGVLYSLLEDPHHVSQADYRQVAYIMKKLGFKRKKARMGGIVANVYMRGTEWERQHNQIDLHEENGIYRAEIRG